MRGALSNGFFGSKQNLKLLVLICIVGLVTMVSNGYAPQDKSFISIIGRVNYLKKEYPDLYAKIYITEDGKPFKTIKADGKGRFEAKISFDHVYIFHLSMDFHATSKVEINTKVPDNILEGNAGGIFEFDCDIYELFEEINYSILNKPLIKVRFIAEKNDFVFNEKYTNDMQYDLDGFRDQIAEMKQRRKEVVQDLAQTEVAKEAPVEKKAKVIEFKSEKKKPIVNTKGRRNIMDMLNEEEPKEEELVVAVEEPVENEYQEADSILSQSEALELDESVVVEKMETEDLFLEEALDESAFVSLKIIPKREELKEVVEETEPNQKNSLEYSKMKIQEMLELTRIEEETKIREEVKSFNYQSYVQKEKRLNNKQIQNTRLRSMIKTIALAEVYYKKEQYRSFPQAHHNLIPIVVRNANASLWVDKELVVVHYPTQKIVFRKETYPFGITYYYKEGVEIDEESYCQQMEELSKREYICAS